MWQWLQQWNTRKHDIFLSLIWYTIYAVSEESLSLGMSVLCSKSILRKLDRVFWNSFRNSVEDGEAQMYCSGWHRSDRHRSWPLWYFDINGPLQVTIQFFNEIISASYFISSLLNGAFYTWRWGTFFSVLIDSSLAPDMHESRPLGFLPWITILRP